MTPNQTGSEPDTRQARTSAGAGASPGLARQLSELARDLQAESSEELVHRRVAAAAVSEIDGATAAGIMLVASGRVRTVGATSKLVEDADRAQRAAGDGPCLTSLREQVTIRADDLRTEEGWPNFARAAAELRVRSMLSFQLFVDEDTLGALNVYSDQVAPFDHQADSTGLLLASHAAIAMKRARVESNLRTALESRDVIGQAKGILMERLRVSPEQAFDMLVVLSQRRQLKLRDLAQEIASTGDLSGF